MTPTSVGRGRNVGLSDEYFRFNRSKGYSRKTVFQGRCKNKSVFPRLRSFPFCFFLINIFVLFLHVWRFLYNG